MFIEDLTVITPYFYIWSFPFQNSPIKGHSVKTETFLSPAPYCMIESQKSKVCDSTCFPHTFSPKIQKCSLSGLGTHSLVPRTTINEILSVVFRMFFSTTYRGRIQRFVTCSTVGTSIFYHAPTSSTNSSHVFLFLR